MAQSFSLKPRCHVDIETYSEIDLKECGVYRYAEDPSTELLCLCYRFGKEGPVTCWIPRDEVPIALYVKLELRLKGDNLFVRSTAPQALISHVEMGGEVAAHNAQFERTVLNGVAGKKLNFPRLQIKQMVCTAVKARTYGLPGALGDCAKALKTYPKDETGRGIMLKLCRPRSGKEKRYAIADEIDDYVHLYAYCVDDVKAECGVDAALPDITAEEREVYWLDQRCNDRGVGVDLGAIADVQSLVAEYKLELEQICLQKIGLRPSQREKIVDWVRTHGYAQITDMRADTVLQAQSDPACPDDVKDILALYAVYGMKAPTKYNAIEAAVCWDIRIRGMMLYYGASTGRWSSILVQLQNLYRPKINDVDTAIELFAQRDLEAVHWMYPTQDPMKVFASCVRGVLIPADGHDLIAMDYAGIESRVLAWIFDEEWKLEAFRRVDRDKSFPDNYQIAYGNAFGVDPLSVKKFERQVGKVMELALGYEGGVGAFVTMAPTYNVDLNVLAEKAYDNLPEWALEAAVWMWNNIERKRGYPSGLPEKVYLTIDGIKQVWRSMHPKVKQGWRDTLDAAKLAVKNPGKAYAIPTRKLMFQVKDRWLLMRLPSGRTLKYFEPVLHGLPTKKLEEYEKECELAQIFGTEPPPTFGEEPELKKLSLHYMGVDSRTKQWILESTYGGKLVENGDQGISNCLLRKGLLRWDARGYWVVLSVHDEGVAEIAEGFGSLDEASSLLCTLDPWATGLPVTAEGWRGKRYRKS